MSAAPDVRGARPAAYVGLMSGTSLDGISAAVVRFHDRGLDAARGASGSHGEGRASGSHAASIASGSMNAELLAYSVLPYAAEQRRRLHDAMLGGHARDYCRLAFDLGAWLADAARDVIAESGVARGDIRAVGTHGQTLWHEPGHSTWQLGEAAVIAERLGVDVVSDFRVRDVAAGGQGAPLVPVADALLFSGDEWRALQNIGGIGNVTVVPPAASLTSTLDGVRAFDTGPGVAVLDAVVRALYPGMSYDTDGRIAAQGSPVIEVVQELLRAPYFSAPPPKSTGRELFSASYAEALIARCRELRRGASDADVVATATALTAHSIADAYRRFLPEPASETVLSGGGAKNPVLVRLVSELLRPMAVRSFDELYFDGEAKEAVAFALLARLHVERQPGNVLGATGAKGPRILGKLSPA